MVKANIKPIFNTDMTILRTLYSFLLFFLFFDQKIRTVKEKKTCPSGIFFFKSFLVIEIYCKNPLSYPNSEISKFLEKLN